MTENHEFVETLQQNKYMKAKQLMQVDFYRGVIHGKLGMIICAVRIRGEGIEIV